MRYTYVAWLVFMPAMLHLGLLQRLKVPLRAMGVQVISALFVVSLCMLPAIVFFPADLPLTLLLGVWSLGNLLTLVLFFEKKHVLLRSRHQPSRQTSPVQKRQQKGRRSSSSRTKASQHA